MTAGKHNSNLEASRSRLISGQTYRDCSTVLVMPTRGVIPAKVVNSLCLLMSPMNQPFHRIFVEGKEVGEAYQETVESLLGSGFKYMLTMEEDNLPPPDGLLKLLESIQKFDVVGGLYWTKGDAGMPMLYGSPAELPHNFRPQLPIPNALQPVNGLGMGFTLFRMSIFRELEKKKVPKPWFKTLQEWNFQEGGKAATQDLYFFSLAAKYGFTFAGDNRVLVGHLDQASGTIW